MAESFKQRMFFHHMLIIIENLKKIRIDFSHVNNFSHSEISGWTIQLGITRRLSHSYLGQKLKVKRVIAHPNYNLGVAHDNDIALFQVNIHFIKSKFN